MNKNTIIGIGLILAIIVIFSLLNKPSKEDFDLKLHKADSLFTLAITNEDTIQKIDYLSRARSFYGQARAMFQDEKYPLERIIAIDSLNQVLNPVIVPSQTEDPGIEEIVLQKDSLTGTTFLVDSAANQKLVSKFGVFAPSALGEREFCYIENDMLKMKVSTQGGRVYSVELKKYKTLYNPATDVYGTDTLPLVLFNGDSTVFGLKFFAENRSINTNQLYFEAVEYDEPVVVNESPRSLKMRLNAAGGRYIEYVYSLEPGSYMVDFKINIYGMNDVMSGNMSYMDLDWQAFMPRLEKSHENENNFTSVFYKHHEDDVDQLSERSDDEENITTPVKWVAFKQQFFSSILIADEKFKSAYVKQEVDVSSRLLKKNTANISIAVPGTQTATIPLKFYFGPNKYPVLTKYDLDFERMIPLGWGFFLMQWINRFAVIPVFSFLENYITSYGLIILILTLLLKLVLFPLTYKSYKSTAKMRVLKPQIDEINEKIPKEKTMERQQATMALYKKVGVSPMGGCLPMLLQFPILIAMFRFFPASIELRQKGFLWADDLSSYDSILDLPFSIPFYGDHVSLFTLLMTASTLVYTHMQQKMNPSGNTMPGMKYMMYLFPIMFLFFLNSYSSGLSYYYFIANMITFGQMWLIRKFVDDEAVLAKLEASKKKPVKKSNFQARLEKMAKQRGLNPKK